MDRFHYCLYLQDKNLKEHGMNFLALMLLPVLMVVSESAFAAENVIVQYDRTERNVRMDMSRVECHPGNIRGFQTPSYLTFDGSLLQSLNSEFLALGIDGAFVHEDVRKGDHCADLRGQLEYPHRDFVVGEVRFTTTEHFGIRFGMCWNWMQREITFSTRHNGLTFAPLVNDFQIGPAGEEKCQ
jgi:hypothetical protein